MSFLDKFLNVMRLNPDDDDDFYNEDYDEEYTIVKTGTTYGIALYDHIALDGTKIDENQLIK